jgi:hypothetical protein
VGAGGIWDYIFYTGATDVAWVLRDDYLQQLRKQHKENPDSPGFSLWEATAWGQQTACPHVMRQE